MQAREDAEQEMTNDRSMIIVPVNLLAKIDMNRDKLSRAEFIELCIDTLTERGDEESRDLVASVFPAYGMAQPRKPARTNVTRDEFDELKTSIKDMLRAFVACMPQHMADSWNEATSDAQERSKQLLEMLDE